MRSFPTILIIYILIVYIYNDNFFDEFLSLVIARTFMRDYSETRDLILPGRIIKHSASDLS